MNKNCIYINSLPCKDNNHRGKKYNDNFLFTLSKKSKNNLKIYVNNNQDRNKIYNFKNYLYQFNAKEIFDKLVRNYKEEKYSFKNKKEKIYQFEESSKIASYICKSKKLRLRLASELDRYSNKFTMSETYDLIYKLALIYFSKLKKFEINHGIFYETPHSFWDTILLEVMKLINCSVVILTRTLFDNLLLDREDLYTNQKKCNHCLFEIYKIRDYIKNISSSEKYIEIKSFGT